MEIVFKEEAKTFHLYNDQISYILTVLPNGQLGQLYFGKAVRDRDDFSFLLETCSRPMASCVFDTDTKLFDSTCGIFAHPAKSENAALKIQPAGHAGFVRILFSGTPYSSCHNPVCGTGAGQLRCG